MPGLNGKNLPTLRQWEEEFQLLASKLRQNSSPSAETSRARYQLKQLTKTLEKDLLNFQEFQGTLRHLPEADLRQRVELRLQQSQLMRRSLTLLIDARRLQSTPITFSPLGPTPKKAGTSEKSPHRFNRLAHVKKEVVDWLNIQLQLPAEQRETKLHLHGVYDYLSRSERRQLLVSLQPESGRHYQVRSTGSNHKLALRIIWYS